MKKTLLIFILIIINAGLAQASDNGGAFLEKGASARSIAMGQSNVSLANGSEAVYWNPAGIAYTSGFDLQSMSTRAFETDYQAILIATKISDIKVGLGYIGAGMQGINETVHNIATNRYILSGKSIKYQASALLLSTGFELVPGIALGATAKAIKEEAYIYKATGYGMDIGAIYKPYKFLTLALNVHNIIKPEMKWDTPSSNIDTVPHTIKAGISCQLLNDSLILAGECDLRNNRPNRIHAGIEYTALNILPLRAGYSDGEINLGLGLIISPLTLDFAWSHPQLDVISDYYTFSLGFKM